MHQQEVNGTILDFAFRLCFDHLTLLSRQRSAKSEVQFELLVSAQICLAFTVEYNVSTWTATFNPDCNYPLPDHVFEQDDGRTCGAPSTSYISQWGLGFLALLRRHQNCTADQVRPPPGDRRRLPPSTRTRSDNPAGQSHKLHFTVRSRMLDPFRPPHNPREADDAFHHQLGPRTILPHPRRPTRLGPASRRSFEIATFVPRDTLSSLLHFTQRVQSGAALASPLLGMSADGRPRPHVLEDGFLWSVGRLAFPQPLDQSSTRLWPCWPFRRRRRIKNLSDLQPRSRTIRLLL